MGVRVGARGEELQDNKKNYLEASILVHRWYRNVIQRIHAYRWQQQGREGEDRREGWEGRREDWEDRRKGRDGREDRREGEGEDRWVGEGGDRREEEAPHQLELQQIEKI